MLSMKITISYHCALLKPRTMSFVCASCRQSWRETLALRRTSRILASTSRLNRQYSTARERPPRVGIIGSGPAGFYAARRLQQKVDGVKIDMYEMLPTPYGLVRFGVAPDHPEVKVGSSVASRREHETEVSHRTVSIRSLRLPNILHSPMSAM